MTAHFTRITIPHSAEQVSGDCSQNKEICGIPAPPNAPLEIKEGQDGEGPQETGWVCDWSMLVTPHSSLFGLSETAANQLWEALTACSCVWKNFVSHLALSSRRKHAP